MRPQSKMRLLGGLAAILCACPCGGQGHAGADAGSTQPGSVGPEGGRSGDLLTYEPSQTTVAACWACAKRSCSAELTACASDLACTTAVFAALMCADSGQGGAAACFESAFVSAGDAVESSASRCLQPAYDPCGCRSTYLAPEDAATIDPNKCVPDGTSLGSSGNYGCTSSWNELCPSGDLYKVTCSCPEGVCICSGPTTTNTIQYPGCPFCPNFPPVGKNAVADVFALCGFPAYQ